MKSILLQVEDIVTLVQKHGINHILQDIITELRVAFNRWHEFDKTARIAHHVKDGVMELMPIADTQYYAYKFVNGHPQNPLYNKFTVCASGQLAEVTHGYPLLITEMTLLTAIRTAATSALASDLMARKNSNVLSIIGTGAQSEFQILAHLLVRPITRVRYFDTDPQAMKKFMNNLSYLQDDIIFEACSSAEEAIDGSDIVIVVTATKAHVQVVKDEWIKPGMHINGLGGDCPGKTELEKETIKRARTVVEYFEQSFVEGEIQVFTREEAEKVVYAHLYELINNTKQGRKTDNEITCFDSVGFALEDFAILQTVYQLAQKYNIGQQITIVPPVDNPKDLFQLIATEQNLTSAQQSA